MPARVGSESGLGRFRAYVGILYNNYQLNNYYYTSWSEAQTNFKGS